MNIVKDYVIEMRVSFKSGSSNCVIGGPISKGELLLMAFLIYTSKGDLNRPIGVSYGNVKKFEKYCLDISLKEFHELCLGLSRRRGWCQNRCGYIGMLWVESYQKRGWWGVYSLSHVLRDSVDGGNYMKVVEKMLRLV